MSVRSRVRRIVPRRYHPAVRHAYLRVGSATAALRTEPEFLVIGGQRCGTTTLFQTLSQHPQVARPPVEKGTDFFTLYYAKGLDWYRGHFPVRIPARPGAPARVPFEACTYYLFHPFAMERIARAFPDIKLVAMLRDPVERAYSAYKHERARGFETETDFERALLMEDSRLDGEVERMRADPTYESYAHRHQAYLSRGQFAEQLERVYQYFSPAQVHVMESEAFFNNPVEEWRQLMGFLGLASWAPKVFEHLNARPGSPMPAGARELLEEHYRPHNEKLAALLGRDPYWAARAI